MGLRVARGLLVNSTGIWVLKSDTPLFAAVDLGSNAFRMMIGQPVKRDQRMVIQEVKTLREPVRLAEGFQGRALDNLALERGWLALERFGKRLRHFEAGRVRAVATSAVREAENGGLFLKGAQERLGFPIDVISGREEAKLVYAGVAHTMPDAEIPRLVVDIGGGSTELIVGQGERPLLAQSIAIGSGTFSKRYFPGGHISALAMQEAERAAIERFEKVAQRYRKLGWQQAIGSSGTARMLAKLIKLNGLNSFGETGITYAALLRLSVCLLEAGNVQQLRLVGLQSQRMSTLPGGLAIMLAAFKVFAIEDMQPSEPGLRMGVLHGLLGLHNSPLHKLA
jgi:exopolyphosphatase/guanosine-5'-triphosphate,3'-diphosphate pyrophosphatase